MSALGIVGTIPALATLADAFPRMTVAELLAALADSRAAHARHGDALLRWEHEARGPSASAWADEREAVMLDRSKARLWMACVSGDMAGMVSALAEVAS